ncbi:MAG: LLM class F420-dependent oxidoreductase [Kiritimatiellia bacterium]|jgi:probable F420-dependent oxidoreductase|nr:LLM class F420-dependent oxidoreductase [Pseudomonadales bacterium]MDP6469944.1 LLM class F420-dependent oxidoreductase [Pseudomonadales bacterium]MDP6828964.1 LLM class F420-dependent oxidoreductase [Pseudomonadales bacterium]MDP7024669.1 LLM class F420-dependent oxidoreductase [Kiritimatiellia bacterium]|tara:strand:+ start:894 stop:1811 length:918 start_codon:yes stop_codon:yes gene_type:complete
MKVGLAFGSSVGIDGESALEICRRAEAVGFESVWGGEHVILPDAIHSRYPYTEDGKIPAEPDTPIPDPLIWLAYVAAAAPTLRLGTCILIVPQRNPLVLAKELATLDRLSGGRVELGLGVGWLREEFEALGIPWERRGARNDEYIAAMRALWAAPHAEYHGEFVDFEPVTCSPRPVNGSIPIIVGGDTDAAIGRAVRHADGYFPGEGNFERLRTLLERVRQAAEDAGRDPASLAINAMFDVQMMDPAAGVEQMAALGVDRIMVPAFFFAGPDGMNRLAEFGERVVSAADSARVRLQTNETDPTSG